MLNRFIFQSYSKDDKSFYKFYILQLLLFSAGLAKGTAIGFILYKLGLSPKDLGVFTSLGTIGALLGHLFTPSIHKVLKNPSSVFLLSQYAIALHSILLMLYILYCFYNNNFGNFWFWTVTSTISFIFVSVEQTSRPLLIKKNFPHVNFSKIMRQDVLTMGVAKVIGFSTGAVIVSNLWVFYIFLAGFLVSVAMINYVKKISKQAESKLIINTSSITPIIKKDISYMTTISMHLMTSFLLFPINTQAITYAKVWDIPFYWFYLSGALGNVFFNMLLGTKVGLNLGKYYLFYMACLVAGFSLFFISNHFVLLGSFLIGGAYSSLSILSTSRLYEGTSYIEKNLISRFYFLGSIVCIISSYLLGLAFGNLQKDTVFAILILLTISGYGSLVIIETKKTK